MLQYKTKQKNKTTTQYQSPNAMLTMGNGMKIDVKLAYCNIGHHINYLACSV